MFVLKERADKIIRLLELTKTDACVVKSFENRRYLTGLATSAGMVVITKKGNRYVVVDDRYEEIATKQLVPQGFIVRGLLNYDNYAEIMYDIVQRDHVSVMLLESEGISHEEYVKFENSMYSKVMPLKAQLNKIRAVKDFEEVENIKTAQRISEKVFDEILGYIKPGMTELELQAELIYCLYKNGGQGLSFDPIVVSGPNTSLPHGVAGDRVIREGDFVTMDFGVLYQGYCSDMTRTVAVGYATDEMKEVYNTVLKAQLAGIAATKAGVPGKDIDAAARQIIVDAGYGPYFGHGYGHSLGLEIHEAPNPNSGNPAPMPLGAVASAEPGVYLPGKFGVRIEDVTIYLEDGCEDITHSPKNLIIV